MRREKKKKTTLCCDRHPQHSLGQANSWIASKETRWEAAQLVILQQSCCNLAGTETNQQDLLETPETPQILCGKGGRKILISWWWMEGVRVGQTPADMSSSAVTSPSYLLWEQQINPQGAHMQEQWIQPELSSSEVNCKWLIKGQIVLPLLMLPGMFCCEWSLWLQLVAILMGAD